MGSGIAAMHYIGMEAMRLPAMCHYSPGLVALSVALAVVISLAALRLTFEFRDETRMTDWRRLASAVIMGVAIPVMHYTGMAAVSYVPMATAGGLTHADVVRTTVFLADMDDFAAMNEVYRAYFSEPYPARSTVQAARLPRDARIEIDAIAVYNH